MKELEKQELKNIFNKFNAEIYNNTPIFITSERFWDGGINSSHSLIEKSEFYSLANKMSNIVKELSASENIFIADFLCENANMYFNWSDRKEHEIFREIYKNFKKHKCYKLTVEDDADLIDLIIESNFRYFSNISLFLPNANLIIQPTCHTEIIVYSFEETEKIINTLNQISSKYPEIEVKV